MKRMTEGKENCQIDFDNIRQSYKIGSPLAVPWMTLGHQLKIEQVTPRTNNYTQAQSEPQISYNAFSKTKQLFKKRQPSSIIADDLNRQHAFSTQHRDDPPQQVQLQVNRFQFDSFGAKNYIQNTPIALLAQKKAQDLHEDANPWNSGSFQINFNKTNDHNFHLPICSESTISNKFQTQHTQIIQNSSIKQFCFKLTDTKDIDFDITPVKKWNHFKKIHQRVVTQSDKVNMGNKIMLKKSMDDCLEIIERMPCEELTDEITNDAQEMLRSVSKSLRKMGKRKLIFQRDYGQEKEDSSQTMKLSQIPQDSYTKRREITQTSQYQKRGRERIFECRNKLLPQPKTDRKNQKRAQPFRC